MEVLRLHARNDTQTMKKEEIKAAIKAEEDKILEASDQIRRLKNDLIAIANAECGFVVGEKVKVSITSTGIFDKKTVVEFGIFAGHEFRASDNPEPVVYKVKKDGTPSSVRLYTLGKKIEKA